MDSSVSLGRRSRGYACHSRGADTTGARGPSARLGRQRKRRHDLLAGGGVADRGLAFLLDFLDADDALHRQVQHAGVAELVAQAFLGRVDHHAVVHVEHQLADFGEAPQLCRSPRCARTARRPCRG